MDSSPFPDWFPWFAGGWIAGFVLLSVLFRKVRGKPLIPRVPPGSFYAESRASGTLASNCLIVAVTGNALIVIPRFPFNLMFLPEMYGFEHDIPLHSITGVSETGSRWGTNIVVSYGGARELRLKVRNPEALASALRRTRAA